MNWKIKNSKVIEAIARAGFGAKALVYFSTAALAIAAGLQVSNTNESKADKTGIMHIIADMPAGNFLLTVMAIGLFCYVIWRFIQAVFDTEDKGTDLKGLAVRGRYLFSALVYGFAGYLALKTLTMGKSSGGSNQKMVASEILSKPMGQWLLGIAALVLLGVGAYQIWYGWSEKFNKHVQEGHLTAAKRKMITAAGKAGYSARGIIWVLIAWLFSKAALHKNAAEAGGTGEAMGWLGDSEFGSVYLVLIGSGLMCYAVFNVIRAIYDSYQSKI